MAVTNVAEKERYFDFDRGIGTNSGKMMKALIRAYNFLMWFFVRDSWMALLPRWCGFLLFLLAILRITGF